MSGLFVIDPDHEMLEGDEKQFHMATVSMSLQARLRLLCSWSCAASRLHCPPAAAHHSALQFPHGVEGGGKKSLRG